MEEVLKILDYNHDGKIDIDDIFDYIINKMKIVKKKKNMTGDEKRNLVLEEIKRVYGQEILEKFKPILIEFVNFYFRRYMKKCFKCL